jgi:hypothetical protein
MCPYPDRDAAYNGGDPTLASSYTCRHDIKFTNPFSVK